MEGLNSPGSQRSISSKKGCLIVCQAQRLSSQPWWTSTLISRVFFHSPLNARYVGSPSSLLPALFNIGLAVHAGVRPYEYNEYGKAFIHCLNFLQHRKNLFW